MIPPDYAKRMCRSEYVAHRVYLYASRYLAGGKLRKALSKASGDELRHYEFWRRVGGECGGPSALVEVLALLAFSALFGITVLVRTLERMEGDASRAYEELSRGVPEHSEELKSMAEEERVHEEEFASSIDEARVRYLGSIVLGVSDALIELTGVYAGALGVLESARTAGTVGLLAGLSASISMAAASYAQAKHEAGRRPGTAALYTGLSYLAVVLALAAPYFLADALLLAFVFMVISAILIVAYVSVYSSVLFGRSYLRELASNAAMLLGVSAALYALGRALGSLAG